METQIKETAKELGFQPRYKPLTEEEMNPFITILMCEPKEGFEDSVSGKRAPFPIQILEARLSGLDLKLKFSGKAKLLLLIYTEGVPGKVVTSLIDCLTQFGNKDILIDEEKLIQVYPDGFYTDESFRELIDDYLKPKKVAWSEIY